METDKIDWKERVKTDFSNWIEGLPDTPPQVGGVGVDSCDLYTLLSEFTALRQEIRMQIRDQRKTVKSLNSQYNENAEILDTFTRNLPVMTDDFQNISSDLKQFEKRTRRGLDEKDRRDVEKKTMVPFLDIRDALIRGLASAREAKDGPRSFFRRFRRRPRELDGLIEGYEMAIRRFDRALHQVDVRPMDAVGKPFDPRTMRVVDTHVDSEMEKGTVVEERFCGFIRGDEVIRTAEVTVVD